MESKEILGRRLKSVREMRGLSMADLARKIDELAAELRSEWNLGLGGICGLVSLLEEHGVKVMEIDADESFDGLSGTANGCPVIILNRNFVAERKRFTALHELGEYWRKSHDGRNEFEPTKTDWTYINRALKYYENHSKQQPK